MALSGCGGKTKTAAALAQAGPAEFDETTGGVEGVVVNDEGEPVAGATAGIPDLGLEAVTDDAGAFSLSHVAPGVHSLYASAIGFTSAGVQVTVVAGETTAASLELARVALPDATYSKLEQNRGMLVCGTGTYVLTQVICGGNDPSQRFLFKYNITTNMSGVLWEQSWNPTQLLSKDLVINIERDGCGATCPGASTFGSRQGCCLLRIGLPAAKLDIGNVKAHTEGATIQSRTFPAFSSEEMLPTVFTQQAFDIYVEYFFGELPADFETRTNVP